MDQPETGPNNVQRSGAGPSSRRTISVNATSEVVCPPDIIQFVITVCSSKETHEAAQTSVKRRTDYIVQVLRNNGIRDSKNVKMLTDVSRGESDFTVQSEVLVEHSDMAKCEVVRNLLIEKMDSSIQFSLITCHYSPEIKEQKRWVPILTGYATYLSYGTYWSALGTCTLCFLKFLLCYALIPNTKPIMLIILYLLCSQLMQGLILD